MMTKAAKKMISIVLPLILLVLSVPSAALMPVYAGGDKNIDIVLEGAGSGDCVTVGTVLKVRMSKLDEAYGESFQALYDAHEVGTQWCFEGETPNEAVFSGGVTTYTVKEEDIGKVLRFYTYSVGNVDTDYNNATRPLTVVEAGLAKQNYVIRDSVPSKTDGSFTLTGHSESVPFSKLLVYDDHYKKGKVIATIYSGVENKMNFSFKFDVSKYAVGTYNLVGILKDDTKVPLTFYSASEGAFYETYFLSGIYEQPAIKKTADFFSTGYDYVCFSPYFTVPKDSHTNKPLFGYIWIQLYDTKTKEWGDKYGPFDSYERLYTEYFKGNKKKGGTKIEANRTYKARVQYRKEVSYNGVRTPIEGPYSNVVTIKTGKSKKLAIKSITGKVKYTKKTALIQKAHWDIYGKWHPYKKSYLWTTTYKVTVTLKRKPGTKGIIIGDTRVKGNKLRYTATFTDSGKLRGKRIKFGICTFNDTKTGAYGKAVKKKVLIK